MKQKLVSILLAVVLTACSSAGHDFDTAGVSSLKPGLSTVDDARVLFGKPTFVTYGPDGGQVVFWAYSKTDFFEGNVQRRSLLLLFDNKKRFIQSVDRNEMETEID